LGYLYNEAAPAVNWGRVFVAALARGYAFPRSRYIIGMRQVGRQLYYRPT